MAPWYHLVGPILWRELFFLVCVERVIVECVITAAVFSHMVIAAFTEAAAFVAFKVSAAEADYGSFSSFAFRHGGFPFQ